MEQGKNVFKSDAEILQEYPAVAALLQTDEEKSYVQGISSQHFKSNSDTSVRTMGSVVYSESCPGALQALELIADKLGNGDESDRKKLIGKGAPASCMLSFCKYFIVEGISGESRIISVNDLNPNQNILLKPSPKGTPSLVISSADVPLEALKSVDFATIIIGPASGRDGETVWTMHAGHPAPLIPIQKDNENKPVRDGEGRMIVPDSFGWKYGDQITAAEVIAKLGPDIFVSIEMANVGGESKNVSDVKDGTKKQVDESISGGKLDKEKLANLAHLEVEIDADLKPILDAMNADLGLKMQARPEGFHVTIIGPTETSALKNITEEQIAQLNLLSERIAKGEAAKVMGIGMVDGSKDPVPAKDKDKKTAFVALDPTAINEFRVSLGLPPRFPHITLGFENGDIHMELTGKKDAKGKDILSFYPKVPDIELGKYLPLIGALKFAKIGGPEKQRKGGK